jgi:cytochrome c551/c552
MKQITLGFALLMLLLGVIACNAAEGQSLSPTATSEPVTDVATATPPATPPANGAADSATNAADNAGLPASIAALLPNADPGHGRELTVQYGCTACHALEEGTNVVGPSWYNIGAIAATRVPDESAALYLYHSIVDPNQYVVEGFLPNLMPQTYQEQLSEEDLADMIQYMLTLQQ